MFLIFAGLAYYPSGGWKDYKGVAPTMENALEFVANLDGSDWWQIVSGGQIVKEGKRCY